MPKKKLVRLFATFADFDKAREVLMSLKELDLREACVEDIELYSPIEHPEVEEILGEIQQPIERFTFFGAITGAILTFIFVAGVAQSMFTYQPQGGKPVIPIPPDMVITYEGTILFGVYITVAAFLIYARLPKRVKKHYSPKVSEDQIAVEVDVYPEHVDRVKEVLKGCGAEDIREVRS